MKEKTINKLSAFRSFFSGLLPLFVLAHFGHHLLTALPVPLLPMIKDDFALDYTQSGLVVSAFTLSYGIGQLPAGWLADRIGRRVLITISVCGIALAGLIIGLSHTYLMLVIFLALMGIMGGGYHPSAAPLVAASVEPQNRGRALGIHVIGGSASYFLAPLAAAAIATVWGWRGPFIGLAIPTLVFGIVFYLVLGRKTTAKDPEHTSVTSHSQTAPTPGRWRRLVPFIVLTTFTQAVLISAISFIPLFLVDHFGVAEETAAALIALIYSAGLWASPLGGYLSDRLGRIPVILTVCFAAGPAIYLLNLAPYGVGIGALLIILGMIIYIRMPASESYIVSHTSERNRSTILGIYYFAGMEGGGVLTPLMGYLIDRFDFQTVFALSAAALVAVTLVCSMFLWGSRD